jgi:hypothetical protein
MSKGDRINADKSEGRRLVAALASESHQRGDYVGWFETLYARAEHPDHIPWADMQPNPHLVEWAARTAFDGRGLSAVTIGCGLGDDAEFLAASGCEVTAFDISPSAIGWCQRRFPTSTVRYMTADLLALPQDWQFDRVVEIYTVQALPLALRSAAIHAVARLVKPEGRLLAIGRLAESPDEQVSMPWPLTREEIREYEATGLREIGFEPLHDAEGVHRFRAEYVR